MMGTTNDAAQDKSTPKTQSRRDFLKVTGMGLAGAFAAAALGCISVDTRDGRKLKAWRTSSGAIVHDPNLCVGCRRCETACTVSNDGKASAYISRIKVARNLNYGPAGVSAAYAKPTASRQLPHRRRDLPPMLPSRLRRRLSR
jgi:ferredoxin